MPWIFNHIGSAIYVHISALRYPMLVDDAIQDARTAYERQFAGQIGAARAVAFGYARAGLRALLAALGPASGTEVVLSPLTCKVVPLTVLSLKLKPIYADVSADTLNLDPAAVRRAIGPATRAVLFQHTYGNPAGLEEVARTAAEFRIPLIEDRAQSLPIAAPLTGRAAVYSNNFLKPLPAGSGGVAVTDDPMLADELTHMAARLPPPSFAATMRLRMEGWVHRRILRPELYWLALRWSGRFDREGGPPAREIDGEITPALCVPGRWQMSEGSRSLARVEEWARLRSECCMEYRDLLAGTVEIPPFALPQPLFYFPVRTPQKKAVLREAARRRVELIPWPKSTPIYPLESATALQAYGFDPASCPVASRVALELIGLPTHDKISRRHRRRVADLFRSFHG